VQNLASLVQFKASDFDTPEIQKVPLERQLISSSVFDKVAFNTAP